MTERDGLIAGLRAMARYEHSDVTQAADAADLLERDGKHIARLEDKALRFDLDAAGIASRELAEARDKRARGTEALRMAFGEELWQLGHPAYVVVHLREELGKVSRLWKSVCVERDVLRAENEALQKKAARADYVAKALVLVDDDAIVEFCMAESVAEFNAAIDAVLAKRADEAKERTP